MLRSRLGPDCSSNRTDMTNRVLRVLLTAFLLVASAIAADAQLNPTVTVLPTPTAPVPANCDQSLAPPAVPRIQVAEIPEPPKRHANAAPPTASVKAQLKDVQNAADRGDRDGFRDALARVKATVAAYPAGGEKDAATQVIRVYDDLDRIWTYQMESRTGAFFDSTTVPAQIMRGYPGFDRAIADQTFVDARGTRFYPTSETRDFLVRETAQRLKNLGVSVVTRAPRPPRVLPRLATTRPKAEPQAAEKREAKETTSAAKPKPPLHRTTAQEHHAGTKIAEAHQKAPAPRKSSHQIERRSAKAAQKTSEKPVRKSSVKPVEKPAPKAVAEKAKPAPTSSNAPSSPSPAASTTSSTTPAAPDETTSASAASAPIASAAATTSAASAISTTATETTSSTAPATTETTASAATTDTTSTAAKGRTQGKGVILPIILIVVGIGVLIVLFRASS